MTLEADSGHVAKLAPSPNFGERRGAGSDGANMLIMHYTGMLNCAKAIAWLANPESNVSCHYVVDVDGTITQMVAERHRAWHAGAGYWAGEKDINSVSVGIEIHNPGHELGYPEFPEAQMRAVTALAQDIIRRNRIPAQRVLGHSDVAPLRKGDPGEKFDWPGLAAQGVGYWLEPAPLDKAIDFAEGDKARGAETAAMMEEALSLLARFGYNVSGAMPHHAMPRGVMPHGVMPHRTDGQAAKAANTGNSPAPISSADRDVQGERDAIGDSDRSEAQRVLRKTVLAFQRHYRPAKCDGLIDASTLLTLRQLVSNLPAPVIG